MAWQNVENRNNQTSQWLASNPRLLAMQNWIKRWQGFQGGGNRYSGGSWPSVQRDDLSSAQRLGNNSQSGTSTSGSQVSSEWPQIKDPTRGGGLQGSATDVQEPATPKLPTQDHTPPGRPGGGAQESSAPVATNRYTQQPSAQEFFAQHPMPTRDPWDGQGINRSGVAWNNGKPFLYMSRSAAPAASVTGSGGEFPWGDDPYAR